MRHHGVVLSPEDRNLEYHCEVEIGSSSSSFSLGLR
jgi:hypothetical protein